MGAFDMRRNAIAGQNTFVIGGTQQSFDDFVKKIFEGADGWLLDANNNVYSSLNENTLVNASVAFIASTNSLWQNLDLNTVESLGSAVKLDTNTYRYQNSNLSTIVSREFVLAAKPVLLDVGISYMRHVQSHVRLDYTNTNVKQLNVPPLQHEFKGYINRTYSNSQRVAFVRYNGSDALPPDFDLKIDYMRVLNGNHAIQDSSSKRPMLRQGAKSKYIQFDLIDDALQVGNTALTNCTVIRATTTEVTVQTGQAFAENHKITQDFCAHFVINKTLTAAQQTRIVAEFNKYVG